MLNIKLCHKHFKSAEGCASRKTLIKTSSLNRPGRELGPKYCSLYQAANILHCKGNLHIKNGLFHHRYKGPRSPYPKFPHAWLRISYCAPSLRQEIVSDWNLLRRFLQRDTRSENQTQDGHRGATNR